MYLGSLGLVRLKRLKPIKIGFLATPTSYVTFTHKPWKGHKKENSCSSVNLAKKANHISNILDFAKSNKYKAGVIHDLNRPEAITISLKILFVLWDFEKWSRTDRWHVWK